MDMSNYWMDWALINPDKKKKTTPDQLSQALADAAKYYAVKFGIDPTRAKIHESQQSGQLALMAEQLEITIQYIPTAYNYNHILLSCGDPKIERENEKEKKLYDISEQPTA